MHVAQKLMKKFFSTFLVFYLTASEIPGIVSQWVISQPPTHVPEESPIDEVTPALTMAVRADDPGLRV